MDISQPFGTLAPYNPSYRENVQNLIADAARFLGADNYRAGDLGRRITGLAEWSPFGMLTAADDAQREYGAGLISQQMADQMQAQGIGEL